MRLEDAYKIVLATEAGRMVLSDIVSQGQVTVAKRDPDAYTEGKRSIALHVLAMSDDLTLLKGK